MKSNVNVELLTDGLNFGHGDISGKTNPALSRLMHTLITEPEILVHVDTQDDGCGDGRGVSRIFRSGKKISAPNLYRPKVFGGSLVMAVATHIGLEKLSSKDPAEEFERTLKELKEKNIKYGAHTDQKAHGKNCGCGAIDNFPQIIHDATIYEQEIRNVLRLLGYSDEEALSEVFKGFYAVKDWAQNGYAGSDVMRSLMSQTNIVIKELEGEPREIAIVLNLVNDFTVDQKFIRESTNDEAQVFAVDIWKLEALVHHLYGSSDVFTQKKAFLSELVYTLATAGVLTQGDLPVYRLSSSSVN